MKRHGVTLLLVLTGAIYIGVAVILLMLGDLTRYRHHMLDYFLIGGVSITQILVVVIRYGKELGIKLSVQFIVSVVISTIYFFSIREYS